MGDESGEGGRSRVMEDLDFHADELRFYPLKIGLLHVVHYAGYLSVRLERTFCLCP